jgi:hypothetical protein
MGRNVDRTQKLYPTTLDSSSDGVPIDRLAEVSSFKARLAEQGGGPLSSSIQQAEQGTSLAAGSSSSAGSELDFLAAALFTIVLWFGVLNDVLFPRAARPSDLVMPVLGKLLGNGEDQWVKDFENGSRGETPTSILGVSIPLFFIAGVGLEQVVKALTSSSAFCVQIGVIGCIW